MDTEGYRELSLNEAYRFGAKQGLEREVAEIRDMEIEWDRPYTSTLRRGYIAELFEKKSIFSLFKDQRWPNGNTPDGERLLRRYRKVKVQYEEFMGEGGSGNGEEPDLDEDRFAAESDLRDFLAKNLERVEPALRLYQSGEQTGIEFPVEGGRIDIVAIDRGGRFVVFEFKVSRGRNRALGQLLYYMGWVDKNLGNAPCRGIIIAKEITDDLVIATRRAADVSLFRYHLSVSVERVT